MSKLMWIAGILLVAAALALGLMLFASPVSIPAQLTFESVTILLVGGILALGLGSVISALRSLPAAGFAAEPVARPPVAAPAPAAAAMPQSIPEFGRRATEVAAPAALAEPAANDDGDMDVSAPTRQTIEALEQARKSIAQAFGPNADEPAVPPARPKLIFETETPPPPPPPPPPVAVTVTVPPPAPEPEPIVEPEPEEEAPAEEAVDEEAGAEGQLYVVEERTIRNRPARILSDGTVEAETDEGWMRFENLEHLDEYLDATEPAKA